MTRVVCAGLATRDTIWRVEAVPRSGGRVLADELVVAGGGPAATAAVTIARLGVEVSFVGVVGDDEAGDFVRAGLEAEGVDVTRLAVARGARTAESAILVAPDGERTIVHHPGSASLESFEADGDWLHVDHAGWPLARAAIAAGRAPRRVSLDGGNPLGPADLSGVELYAPTQERLADDYGDAPGALAAGAQVVVATRGAQGALATRADGSVVEAPGVACPALVSTLGAGDVFHGALVAWLARGAELAGALAAANAAASLSCRALDGRSAIPSRAELETMLA